MRSPGKSFRDHAHRGSRSVQRSRTTSFVGLPIQDAGGSSGIYVGTNVKARIETSGREFIAPCVGRGYAGPLSRSGARDRRA